MNSEHKDLIGKRVRMRRRELGMSQDELGNALGYRGKAVISKVENGITCIPPSRIGEYAKVLQCDAGFLLALDSEKRAESNLGIGASMQDVTLVTKFNSLTDINQSIVMNLIDGLIRSQDL